MSQENVEIVYRLVDAWNRRDLEATLALCDPEIEYVQSPTATNESKARFLSRPSSTTERWFGPKCSASAQPKLGKPSKLPD